MNTRAHACRYAEQLLTAAYQGHLGTVQSLLGSNGGALLLQARSSTGETAVHAAVRGRQLHVLSWLLAQAPVLLEAPSLSGSTVRTPPFLPTSSDSHTLLLPSSTPLPPTIHEFAHSAGTLLHNEL